MDPIIDKRQSDAVLDRLMGLHPKLIDLSLDRTLDLLERLGRPQDRLPPVVHVAGTNGKGSLVAVLRAIAEAAGLRVHVYTSPHLVRFAERIRLAGAVIAEDRLTALLEACEAANEGPAGGSTAPTWWPPRRRPRSRRSASTTSSSWARASRPSRARRRRSRRPAPPRSSGRSARRRSP